MLSSMSETVPTDSQNRLGGRSDNDELDADVGQLCAKWLKFIYWRSCVFGFLILKPLTFMGLSQSSPPEQLFFATPATMLSDGFQVGFAYVNRVLDAHGKFGEHEKCVRVARGAAESNSCFLRALQTSQVHP